MGAPLQIAVPVPAAVGAGTTKTVIPRIGMAGRLVKADAFAAVSHCTGGSAALTYTVQVGASGSEATIATLAVASGHRDSTNVEDTLTLTDTSACNIDEDDRITVSVTTAGGSTATGSGFVVFLTVNAPANP